MSGLSCPLCGEELKSTGLNCPTCSTDVGWWLVTGNKVRGPLELRELREAFIKGELGGVEWILLGAEGLRRGPESVAQLLRASDRRKPALVEDWVDFRNLFRWILLLTGPAVVLALMALYCISRGWVW